VWENHEHTLAMRLEKPRPDTIGRHFTSMPSQ
jgi:hypothetical protein